METGLTATWWLLLPLQAERVFSEVRRLECHRVEGMEIFSTTLWHLQKDVALSALAKDLTDLDRDCPEVSQFTDLLIHWSRGEPTHWLTNSLTWTATILK